MDPESSLEGSRRGFHTHPSRHSLHSQAISTSTIWKSLTARSPEITFRLEFGSYQKGRRFAARRSCALTELFHLPATGLATVGEIFEITTEDL
jgi:hypothetical protein